MPGSARAPALNGLPQDLLAPRRIALVGASPHRGSVGNAIWKNLVGSRSTIELHAVGRHRVTSAGAHWHKSVDRLPPGPGLAILAVPAAEIAQMIRAIGSKGWRVAIVVSAGLGKETEPRRAMMAAAAETGVRLIGPNCLGILLPRLAINASFASSSPPGGNLALLSQSGAIATAMIEWAAETQVGFSAMISVGDMAQTGMAELVRLLGDDRQTNTILIYLEGLTDGPAFLAAAREIGCRKPIVVLKAGRSAAAGRATLSHTGALAGSWDVYRAAFDEAGIVNVDTLDELCIAARALRFETPLHGNQLAILTNGGGGGILAVDALAGTSGRLAELTPATFERLEGKLPALCARANPLDIVGDADAERYRASLAALLADPGCDAVLVINCPTGVERQGEAARAVAECTRAARRAGLHKPVLGCWLGPANFRAAEIILAAERIASFSDPSAAIFAFEVLLRRGRQNSQSTAVGLVSQHPSKKSERANAIIKRVKGEGRRLLSEVEAKEILSSFDIPVIATKLARDANEVAALCAMLPAPFVLKIVSRDISHKSEVGGVALDIPDCEAARQAATAMLGEVARRRPEARIDGFSVQPMVKRAGAIEVFAGMAIDATFGPVLMFGAGGTAIEVINDKSLMLAPVDRDKARSCIARTRIARLLGGYRDQPPCDLDALVHVLERLANVAESIPGIAEIDINPLLASADGAIALDARIVLTP